MAQSVQESRWTEQEPWVGDFMKRVEEGDRDGLVSVLAANKDACNVRNQKGETPLILSSRLGHENLIRILLNEDTDVDDWDDDGWTPLLNACAEGHETIVRLLIDSEADIELPDLMGWTPLMWAAYKKRAEVVELLLREGARPNLMDEEDGLTPLILCAARGCAALVQQLLAAGAQVNACDKFGSTSLIWAARKGYVQIVEQLLTAGAEIDAVGMLSSTALMLATRGNYLGVIELLLSRDPNVNSLDQNGCTALSVAAREGYVEAAMALMESGAYVNVIDRMGDPLIMNAVRSGNVTIVRELLDRYADVNAKDSSGRTALHLAIEKAYVDIVVVLLDRKPNLEIKTKDGETCLLRAVKGRNAVLSQLLVHSGAKVSASDKNGDNCLHLALRARSRHLTQILLARPNDARLLYRPNNDGDTPYSIDQSNAEPILPYIFGPLESQTESESMLGYDVYSNVLADILCEPNLSLPLTLGMYAKWGSGKSFLLTKMKRAMKQFSRCWLDTASLSWSWTGLLRTLGGGLLLAATIAAVTSLAADQISHLIWPLLLLLFLLSFILILYGMLYYASEIKGWRRWTLIANSLARRLAYVKLFFNVIFFHPAVVRDKDLLACPVSFLFAEYQRLSSVGGEQALAKIIITLFESVESHYGLLTSRLLCALHTSYADGNKVKYRRICGAPLVLIGGIVAMGSVTALTLLYVSVRDEATTTSKTLMAALILFATIGLLSLYPIVILLRYSLANAAKRRINRAANHLQKLRFEGFMHRLQEEVDLLTDMVRCMDSFSASQTRLVVIVDGLDNCEQEKMVQTLDALELLFCRHEKRPFVLAIAVDPHIIISAIYNSMHCALTGTDLTGHDYLKNIVSMPFYLHNSALRQLFVNLRERRQSIAQWRDRYLRQETFHSSYVSLNDSERKQSVRQKLHRQTSHCVNGQQQTAGLFGTCAIGHTLLSDDYFSNINPRSMKRIINSLTLTGRLMRAFEVKFSWFMLSYWVSLIEQWPYRMSWLIDYCDEADHLPNNTPLIEVYDRIKEQIPKMKKEDELVEIDRNPNNFEVYLRVACFSAQEQLNVGHLRDFVPCTSNLDPYIRKLIQERRMSTEEESHMDTFHLVKTAPGDLTKMAVADRRFTPVIDQLTGISRYLFKDKMVWDKIRVPLPLMSTDDIKQLVMELDIIGEHKEKYLQSIEETNLTGLVLSVCDISAVKDELKVALAPFNNHIFFKFHH